MTLANAAKNIGTGAGATGIWTDTSATTGTFVAHLPAGTACGGADTLPVATMTLNPCACLKVRVTITGTSGHYNTYPAALAAAGGTGLSLYGGGGGSICSTHALEVPGGGSNSMEFQLDSETGLTLNFYAAGTNYYNPATDCTFALEAIYS